MQEEIIQLLQDATTTVNTTVGKVADYVRSAAMYNDSSKNIVFMHGHPVEIIDNLKQMDESNCMNKSRYPAVVLFQDFMSKKKSVGVWTSNLHLIICNVTTPTMKAHERYNTNFKPLLTPLYNEFISAIELHQGFVGYRLEHSSIDRLYWGQKGLKYYDASTTTNIFCDFVDAIEIEATLLFRPDKCKPKEIIPPTCEHII